MSALFPRWSNTVARVSLVVLAATPAIAIGSLLVLARSPLSTQVGEPIEQPIEFDHRHHVGDEGIDCRYCHSTVDVSPSAGIPPTSTCMNCHAQVWNQSPLLNIVREHYFQDRPIVWTRVNNTPDYVYFNHAIHVNKGVACVTCHGRVDDMASVMKVNTLTMAWCLECHRNPGPNIRPKEFVTSMTWTPPENPEERAALTQTLLDQYDVKTRTSCSTCHR